MTGLVNWLSQVAALTRFGVRTLPQRKGSALAAAFGVAGVVAVLVAVLSIGQGFRRAMTAAGAPDRAIVLRSGADSEMVSILFPPDIEVVASAPAVARGAAGALVSPELMVVVNLAKRSTGTDANVPLRGVRPAAFEVRSEIRIEEGRAFEWGRNEVIVGTGAAREFAGLGVGDELELGRNRWQVVGTFSAAGGLPESEIWTDAAVLQPAYQRGSTYQSVLVRLASAGALTEFEDALSTDPRVNVQVERETDYYAEQSTAMTRLITSLGILMAVLMGLGAVFGALNTMYTAVAARTREIATLRALGFHGGPIVLSVLAEAMLLAAAGGLAGGLAAYLAFDGFTAATMNWQSFSQVAFAFTVSPALLAQGIGYALALGFLGGLFPALRAARLPIATALREL